MVAYLVGGALDGQQFAVDAPIHVGCRGAFDLFGGGGDGGGWGAEIHSGIAGTAREVSLVLRVGELAEDVQERVELLRVGALDVAAGLVGFLETHVGTGAAELNPLFVWIAGDVCGV